VSDISTHVLDLSSGLPALGIAVSLAAAHPNGSWSPVGSSRTDGEGRVRNLLPAGAALARGEYRLAFSTGEYWRARAVEAFHPVVEVVFRVTDPTRRHHVPLLISPFGYSTYRGT